MTISWPGTVPSGALLDTSKITPFRAPTKTDMEGGTFRQRKSTTLDVATIQFSMRLTNAEFLYFKAFVKTTLVDGTLSFAMPIWTGAGYETKTCTFVQPYDDDAMNGLAHTVGLVLDVQDY